MDSKPLSLATASILGQPPSGFYTVDIEFGRTDAPGLTMTNTHHRYYAGDCPTGELHTQSEPHRIMSQNQTLKRRSVDSQVQTEAPPDQKKILFVDETSHPEAGDLLWRWVFTTAITALFWVGHRSREIFDNLMDSCEFDGWLMTDGYQVYRHYLWRLRCWAHLLRKAQGLCESDTASVRGDGEQMLTQLQAVVYRAREEPEGGCQSIMPHYQAKLDQLQQLCEKMRDSPHEKAHALGVEFLLDWEAIFRVLEHPNWPLTNDTAEQRLRHLVMLRRIMPRTRSPQGSRALALFASVITTCRLNASSLLSIRDVIAIRRQGEEAPALPPVPEKIVMRV